MRAKSTDLVAVELTRAELSRIQVYVLDRIEIVKEALLRDDMPTRLRRKMEIGLANTIADLKILSTKVVKYGRV